MCVRAFFFFSCLYVVCGEGVICGGDIGCSGLQYCVKESLLGGGKGKYIELFL